MNSHILVCPLDPSLLERLQGHVVVVRTMDAGRIPTIAELAGKIGLQLHCVELRSFAPLSQLGLMAEWRNIPVAVYMSSIGRLSDVLGIAPLLRELNLKIYLPADSQENCTAIRILSSLGIATAACISPGGTAWEPLTDLMTYALLGMVTHAPIEPFAYISKHYDPCNELDFGDVYFDNPTRYLHVGADGNISLSRSDCEAEQFLSCDMSSLDEDEIAKGCQQGASERHEFFLQCAGCAYCPAWRVCMGKFGEYANEDCACRTFFTELMDVVELYQSKRSGKTVQPWQP